MKLTVFGAAIAAALMAITHVNPPQAATDGDSFGAEPASAPAELVAELRQQNSATAPGEAVAFCYGRYGPRVRELVQNFSVAPEGTTLKSLGISPDQAIAWSGSEAQGCSDPREYISSIDRHVRYLAVWRDEMVEYTFVQLDSDEPIFVLRREPLALRMSA